MPNKQHTVDLSEDERAELESFVSSGVRKAEDITRARILLKADDGRVSRLERRIVERSESGEPRSGGVSGASIGKSVPETPGSILEQAEPRFDE